MVELLNMCVNSCGGLANDASELVRAVGEKGERWSLGTWSSSCIERKLMGNCNGHTTRQRAGCAVGSHPGGMCQREEGRFVGYAKFDSSFHLCGTVYQRCKQAQLRRAGQ